MELNYHIIKPPLTSGFWLAVLIWGSWLVPALADSPAATVVAYPGFPNSRASTVYQVKVAGKPVFVEAYKSIHYAHVAFSGPVEVLVEVSERVVTHAISPACENVKPVIAANTLRFSLDQPGYLSLRVNQRAPLLLLFGPLEENPPQPGDPGVINLLDFAVDATGAKLGTAAIQRAIAAVPPAGTLYVPPGVYKTGTLALKSDMTLYLAAGALLLGSPDAKDYPVDAGQTEADHIRDPKNFTNHGERMTHSRLLLIDNAHDVRIAGPGAVDGQGAIVRAQGKPANLIRVRRSRNITLQDVILRDAAAWNTHILASEDVSIRRVKLLNDPEVANTDGFDPDSSRRVTIEQCFAYCGDDTVAVKASNNGGLLRDVDTIIVRSNVFWTKKSALKVGTETQCRTIRNIAFTDNRVILCDRGMALYCPDGAVFEDIRFVGNYFEACALDKRQRLVDFSVSCRAGAGRITNVLIQDCVQEQAWPKPGELEGYSPTNTISNVRFVNFQVAGQRCRDAQQAQLRLGRFTEQITFSTTK